MATIFFVPPSKKIPPDRWTPFALGFRPFFQLAALYGIVAVADWAWQIAGTTLHGGYYGVIGWHSHEMLFGYTTAVIAGFLLTAVRNWTGITTIHGAALALLAGLWLSARLLAWWPAVPSWLLAPLDLAFLPLLAGALAYPIIRGKHWKSLLFPAMLLAMAAANLLVHGEAAGVTTGTSHTGIWLAMYLAILLMIIMGGRVIPSFTESGGPGTHPGIHPWLESAAAPVVGLTGLAVVFNAPPAIVFILAATASILHSLRLAGWYTGRVWRFPMVWVLHLGYVWIILGLMLQAAAVLGAVPVSVVVHAFTTGGIGMVTVGMMARVSLGHTGRNVNAPPRTVKFIFILLSLAVPVRVLLPWLLPAWYPWWIGISGSLWSVAFALFLWTYAPMLLRARADGHPG